MQSVIVLHMPRKQNGSREEIVLGFSRQLLRAPSTESGYI